MSTQQNCSHSDLVLRLAGGQRDGEIIQINTPKCFLGMESKPPGKENQPHCAIFRGPNGATLRSYGNEVLVNGESKTVHWLALGDQIEFPNAMTVEVEQLGRLESPKPLALEAPTDSTESNEQKEDEIMQLDLETKNRICELENTISEIHQQNQSVDLRFQSLEQGLSLLTDQITNLLSIGATQSPANCQVNSFDDCQPAQDSAEPDSDSIMDSLNSNQLSDADSKHEYGENSTLREPIVESFDADTNESELQAAETQEATPNVEDFGADSIETDSEVMANETGLSTIESLSEKIEPPTELQTENDVTENDEVPAQPQDQESVADLLARMKSEGNWEDISEEADQPGQEVIESTVDQESPEIKAEAAKETGEESDVQDYMSQLLNRMRGGSDQPVASAPVPRAEPKEEVKETKSAEPVTVLREEEYKPKTKAKQIKSLSAMRELANSTARTAVHSSELSRQQALAYVQAAIAVCSLILGGYYIGIFSESLGDFGSIIGVVCILGAGFCGFRCHKSLGKLKQEVEADKANQQEEQASATA